MTEPRGLVLHPDDDVAVAIDPAPAGAVVAGITARTAIPKGHKLARRDVAAGSPVRKFGQVIGVASRPIAAGDHVHVHNLVFDASHARDPEIGVAVPPTPRAETTRTFDGFRRPNGRAGTRNYLGVLTSVNCSATVARHVAQAAERDGLLDAWPTIDGVVPLSHGTGCGMALEGDGMDVLRRTLWGYAANPNFGGVLMIGLGCETFQISTFLERYGLAESDTFRVMTIQETGGTRASVARGLDALREMLPAAGAARRAPIPASELMLALQCGGSDGYSGLTANPALGAAVDLLVAQGGTAILSETPEIYGAEHLLTRRAASRAVGEALLERIRWWEDHVARHGGSMDNNPSPGNKAGGLTTILEKSLGAAAKGGATALAAVCRYAEPVTAKGLVFMDTPGYDPVSATGQVAGGANVMCFTTGRGSAYGSKPTPCLKLATNSDVYARMRDDMDVDCGDVLDGVSIADKGAEIFDAVLAVASGRRTRSEELGYGDAEFVPWQLGATM